VTDVEHEVQSTYRPARVLHFRRRIFSASIVLAVACSSLAVLPRDATASNLSNARQKATILLGQINRINGEVGRLGQKYDEAQIKLHQLNSTIANTKATVEQIKSDVAKSNGQLRSDVIFAFVTSGATEGNNPLFSSNATKLGATSVYTQLAEGNINATIANLKNYRIRLIRERGLLRSEDSHARAVAVDAAASFHKSKVLQASLNSTLAQVKGQIATDVSQEEAAAAASSAGTLQSAGPVAGFPAPPPNSRADLAIRSALSFLGVPYVWGGASRSGVDCSGLVMLAYDAAGISLPHYSGAQYQDTERVPLYDIEPGDLLFYGSGGDQHVAMYLGHSEMIEAPQTGEVVHVTPVRLYGDFAGLGRPR
jgi:cell wall-associated NlpC family hydrolase